MIPVVYKLLYEWVMYLKIIDWVSLLSNFFHICTYSGIWLNSIAVNVQDALSTCLRNMAQFYVAQSILEPQIIYYIDKLFLHCNVTQHCENHHVEGMLQITG